MVISQEPDVISGTSASAFPLRTDLSNLRNAGSVTVNAQATELLSFLVSYSATIYDYFQNDGNLPGDQYFAGTSIPNYPSLSAELDRIEHLITFEAHWKAFDHTTAILGYQFGVVDFTSSEPINGGVGNPLHPLGIGPIAFAPGTPGILPFISPKVRDDYSHYVYAGVQQAIRSDLTVSAKGGIQYVDYYNANEVANTPSSTLSPYADVSVNWAYMDGALAVLGFRHSHNSTDQGIVYSAGNIPSLTLDQESSVVYLSVSQKLKFVSPRLTATVSGQYQNSTWYGGSGSLNNVSDDIYSAGVNLTYQWTKYFSSELGYNFDYLTAGNYPSSSIDINQTGAVYGGGYHRNRVYAGVTASF
jgi:hypothetical protein